VSDVIATVIPAISFLACGLHIKINIIMASFWRTIAQELIFDYVNLSSRNCTGLVAFKLFQSLATFLPYVRSLYFREGRMWLFEKQWVNDALPFMNCFTRVRYLELDDITWRKLQEAPLFTLTDSFPNHFWKAEFDTFDQLVNVFSGHHTLHSIIFHGEINPPLLPSIHRRIPCTIFID
jgi:hypothetical protein